MQVSKRAVDDSAFANWNFNDLKAEEEKLRLAKQIRPEDPYFARKIEVIKRASSNFAPKEPRPLHYSNSSNVFKEKMPSLDDLIETNEEVKKEQKFEEIKKMLHTRVTEAFRADPAEFNQVEISRMVQIRAKEAFNSDPGETF